MRKRESIRNRKLLTLDVAMSDPLGMSLPKPPESGGNPSPPSLPEIDMQRALPPWGADALPPMHDPLVESVVAERFKRMALPSRRIAVGFPWPPDPPRPWLDPSISAKYPRQRGDTIVGLDLGHEIITGHGRPLLPMSPPPGSTPCPFPPRYFPCPLTPKDRRQLDAAEPIIRKLHADMEAPAGEEQLAGLCARVVAGEQPPLAPPWMEQRMDQASLADDERRLVRLLFQERPELATLPGSALLLTRRDPATGEDLGPALLDAPASPAP